MNYYINDHQLLINFIELKSKYVQEEFSLLINEIIN